MDPPSTGLAGMAGADCGSPERDDPRGARDASDSAVGLSDVVAAAPVRSVHQAISCRPEDVRKPARGNSVHRGFAGNADGTTHHGGSHHGYMAFKIQKLAEQNEVVAGRATTLRGEGDPSLLNDARPSERGVFHGVSIHVNGITDPPWMDLKDIMLANGGRFANYYSRVSVTHIVCAGLTAAKLAALKKADRNHPPVVRPAWVTESLKAGKLLPCASFALEGTLEPGQRRIAAFAAPKKAQTYAFADDENADDGGDTESDPDAEDELDAPDVAPTQERDEAKADFGNPKPEARESRERGGEKREASAAVLDQKGEPAPERPGPEKKHAYLRVVFFAVRDHLEALPPGDDDARASARFAATRAASAAAYAALASMIDADASRLVPVSAWEALVVPSASGTGNVDLGLEASRLAEALRAAGVDAGAVPATRVFPAGTRDGVGDDLFASVAVSDDADADGRDPLLDGERNARASGGGPKASREKTPRETRKRVRWSSGVDDDKARGTAGEDGDAVAETKEKETERAARYARRSSFAAAAAAPETDKIDDETWASLPPEVRDEILGRRSGARRDGVFPKARRLRDPTTGESSGGKNVERTFDAFGAHLGIRSAKRFAGPSVSAAARNGPAEKRAAAKPKKNDAGDDGLPASFSQIDPEVLEAIGEEEARTLRAHYERAAREKTMRARRAGGRARSKGGRSNAVAAAGQKNAASFFAKTKTNPEPDPPRELKNRATRDDGTRRVVAADADDDDDDDDEDEAMAVPSFVDDDREGDDDSAAEIYVAPRSDAEVDALAASLETAVHALVAKLCGGDHDSRVLGLETLDAAAEMLGDQACAFVLDDALEWTQRLMLRGLELCGASAAHKTFWKPRFETAKTRVDETVRREHDGAVLVLRK